MTDQNEPTAARGKIAAVTMAAAAVALWALIHFGGKPDASLMPPVEAAVVVPDPPAPVIKPKRPARAPIALARAVPAAPAKPVEPAKIRGAALREKGEALGGSAPESRSSTP